jgi:GntR family transcriptional regulator
MSDPELAEVLRRYAPDNLAGLPKYARLRETLLRAIDDGYWKPLDQLPKEITLAESSPFSLGTVQKALRDLVQSGVVVRQQGRGTFVAQREGVMAGPRHLLFEDDEGNALPLFPHIVAQQADDGSRVNWQRHLGASLRSVVRIDRLFSVAHRFQCCSSFYIDAARFPVFADAQLEALQAMNFKDILRREYNLVIERSNRTLRVTTLPDEVCKLLGESPGVIGSIVDFVTYASDGQAVYYQRAFVPPNPYALRIEPR